MTSSLSRLARLVMMAVLLTLSVAPPATAAEVQPSVLRDAEAELLFREMSAPLIRAAEMDPKNVEVVLLNSPTVNAFVDRGQRVYIYSGLMLEADNVNELQGVIAHELGHVAGGHGIRLDQGSREATGITLATLILGALAVAAGAGDAGLGIMMAGQRAALGRLLAFSRTQESSADQAGAKYLSAAGVTGKGLVRFFGKLQKEEFRLAIYATESYDRTHPLSTERVSALADVLSRDAAWDKPVDPQLNQRFERVKAKLIGYVNPKQAVIKYPESDQSVPAHYARAYAYHVGGYPQKALGEADALLAKDPDDPFFLELKGQVLLESGRPADAIAPLREATERSGNTPLIAAMLGHALIATEKRENFPEAKQVLKAAVGRDNQNPFAWYQLGIIYDREGDLSRAALATAERNNLEGKPKLALVSAEMAMKGIARGTPDYLRAQDIAMVSCAELKKDKNEKKNARCSK
ncbi:MAG: M48 family metalloprotease [Pseudomonadota bacterium]|nr:M48 family metalloprotease [Pseudomonadota bacterium]